MRFLILATACAGATIVAGCGGGSISPSLTFPNSFTAASHVRTAASRLVAPLVTANVAYFPSGGPFSAAPAPGYAQLAASGFEDYTGSQFSLTAQDVLLNRVAAVYGGSLVDDRAPGATTSNSTTVIDFTMGSTSYLNAVARAKRNFGTGYSCSAGRTQLELIAQNGSWRSLAEMTIAAEPGATYAIKLDVAGAALTCKLFDATGALFASVQASDTKLSAGYNGLQFYAPDGVHGATDIRVWYSQQPDSVVGIPRGPHGGPAGDGGPAALLCVHFASNPMCAALPANPNVSASSAAWAGLEFQPGKSSLGALQISNAANRYLDSFENSYPLEDEPTGSATVAQTVVCDNESYSYATCAGTGMNGKAVNIPADMVPEGASDHHFSYNDYTNNGEVDFWDADGPPYTSDAGKLHVGGAGFCAWGSAATACSGSTAVQIATALAGGIDATLIKAAEADAVHGHLPYALGITVMCADVSTSFVYPATASDGSNTNATPACAGHLGPGQRPPEGVRWFLALHDSDVNATSNVPFIKVILRTIDEDHFGGTITDSNWPGTSAGFQVLFHRGDYSFAAAEEGIDYGSTDVEIPITAYGIDLASQIEFCSSGTC